MGKNVAERKIKVWSLKFKPGKDDIRETSSVNLIRALCVTVASAVANDSVAGELDKDVFY